MKNYVTTKCVLTALYVIFALLIEMITFLKLGMGAFPTYFWLTFLVIFAVGLFLFVIPYNWVSFTIGLILLCFQSVISFVNLNLYTIQGNIFTWEMVSLAGETMNSNVQDFVDYGKLPVYIGPILIFVMLSVVTIVKRGKIKKKERTLPVKLSACAIFIIWAVLLTPLTYNLQINNLYANTESNSTMRVDDKSLYNNMSHSVAFFRKFGTFPMYMKNIILGQKFGQTEAMSYDEYYEYFNAQVNYAHGDYWGADSGNNVIVVLMESVDEFLISSKYTPTLYKLQSEGINFTNYHTRTRTDVSETSLMLGSYPGNRLIGSDWYEPWFDTSHPNAENFFDFSVPNRLKAAGFDTVNYFHNASGNFYARAQTHSRYGFDNVRFVYDYDYNSKRPQEERFNYAANWFYPEKWFFELAADDIMPQDKRFFSFITTIHAHGSYNANRQSPYMREFTNSIDDSDFDFTNTEHYPLFKNALAQTMVLDNGIETLLTELENRGLSDNTTLLFLNDHGTTYSSLQFHMKNQGVVDWTYVPVFKGNAFIKSPNVKNIQIDKFVTIPDFVPTIFQLLGLDLNSRLYLGNDAFDSQKPSIVYSASDGIYNDKFFTYDGISINWHRYDAAGEDLDAFLTQVKEYKKRMAYFNMLYSNGCPPPSA